jgi:hypothetical protein
MKKDTQQRFQQASETHRLNMHKTLRHRLEVARAKGDENLIHQLEAESESYK